MRSKQTPTDNAGVCPVTTSTDLAGIETLALNPQPSPADYHEAMAIAGREAHARLGENMLLSWYDRDRGFEVPQHVSECHQASAVPGYVDYGVHHGATLRIDIEQGRFVFFYRPVEI